MDRHRDVPFYRDRSAGFDSVENEPEEIAYTMYQPKGGAL